MKHSIQIDFPIDEMERRQNRLDARLRFDTIDRTPVGFCLVARFFTPIFGINYQEFFKTSRPISTGSCNLQNTTSKIFLMTP